MSVLLTTRDNVFKSTHLGVLGAGERLSWDLRYSFRADLAQTIMEGPFFRLTPILESPEAPDCWRGKGMLPTFDTGQAAYEGWETPGAPALGAIALDAAAPHYDIDAARGVSVVCSSPCSVDLWVESTGTWVFDTYRYPSKAERAASRAFQTRMLPAAGSATYAIPRGCHRVSFIGPVTAGALIMENTGKAASIIALPALTAVQAFGQYMPVGNACGLTVTAGAAPLFTCFEVELP